MLKDRILPLFEETRKEVNYGSPHRTSDSPRVRKPELDFIDLIGFALYSIKRQDPVFKFCPIFCVVPTTAYVSLDFALEVLKDVMT